MISELTIGDTEFQLEGVSTGFVVVAFNVTAKRFGEAQAFFCEGNGPSCRIDGEVTIGIAVGDGVGEWVTIGIGCVNRVNGSVFC